MTFVVDWALKADGLSVYPPITPVPVFVFVRRLRGACDCSFIYWHRVIFPLYLDDMCENVTDTHRVQVRTFVTRAA